jgi:hypothetical protein
MAATPLDIELSFGDTDVCRPVNGHRGECPTRRPLQCLQILEQLAVHPLKQGEQLFPESTQRLLDREPVELRPILLAKFHLERVLSEQLLLDRERQVPDPALNSQVLPYVMGAISITIAAAGER